MVIKVCGYQQSKSVFLSQLEKTLSEDKPLEILCIAGVAPLINCLQWLYDYLASYPSSDDNVHVILTSVEASVYTLNSDNPSVNHNSQIDPNVECDLELIKSKLTEEYSVSIVHYCLCSEICGTKVTRNSCAAISLERYQENNSDHYKTEMQDALERRFFDEPPLFLGKQGTVVRDLPPHAFKTRGSASIASLSTFAHDHKAFFLHQQHEALLEGNPELLLKINRIGVPTSKGRVYFYLDDHSRCNVSEFEKNCRQYLIDKGHELLVDDSCVDSRVVVHPRLIDVFDSKYLDFLQQPLEERNNNLWVITDPGHGYIEAFHSQSLDSDPCNPFKPQDSDDYLVSKECEKQYRLKPFLLNKMISDDNLFHLRSIFEISFAIGANQDVTIHLEETFKPLPFCHDRDNIDCQLDAFSRGASKRMFSMMQNGNPRLTAQPSQEKCYHLYYNLCSTLLYVGQEIIDQVKLNSRSSLLKLLIDEHQRSVNAIAACRKVECFGTAFALFNVLERKGQHLSDCWQVYQNIKAINVRIKYMAAGLAVLSYMSGSDVLPALGVFIAGYISSDLLSRQVHHYFNPGSTIFRECSESIAGELFKLEKNSAFV